MARNFIDWLRTLGAPEDPVATDVSSEWTAMSLLKAIYGQIAGGGLQAGLVVALAGTSATSVAIGTGAKSFTIETGKAFLPGQWLNIASDADETNFMNGPVTSYNSATGALIVSVDNIGGSGTFADWVISLSGTPGVDGAAGTDASLIATGTLPSGRLTGSYTGITGLGTIGTGVWEGTLVGVEFGGTGADLSATGGASQVLKQATTGADITVGTLASTDLSDGTAAGVAMFTAADADAQVTLLSLAQADIAGLTTASEPTFKGLTLAGGTVTDTHPVLTVTQTWNDDTVGTTYDAIKVDITNTLSLPGTGKYFIAVEDGVELVSIGNDYLHQVALKAAGSITINNTDGKRATLGLNASSGFQMETDDGSANRATLDFYVEGGAAAVLAGNVTTGTPNRFVLQTSAPATVFTNTYAVSTGGHYEIEAAGTNDYINLVPYQSGTPSGRTLRVTNDGHTGYIRPPFAAQATDDTVDIAEFMQSAAIVLGIDKDGILYPGTTDITDLAKSTNRLAVVYANDIDLAAAGQYGFNTRSFIASGADGSIDLFNAAGTGFTSLRFGGTAATEPMIKKASAGLEVKLADDSAYANLQVNKLTVATGGGAGIIMGTATNIFYATGSFFDFFNGASNVRFESAGAGNGVVLASGYMLIWGATADATSTKGSFFGQKAAASFRFGAVDAAAPVAQTLGVQGVVAGTTDTAGAALTIAGSQGTGTGAGGAIKLKVAPASGTGSTQNALVDAFTVQPNKSVTVASYIEGAEETAPSAPAANGYRIFSQDNGSGKTQLMVIFASGAAQQIAIEP